jgi:type II secretory ATPase GspE/PulE/Tfp pilus assembly ATPase PilB-like protein
MENWPLPPFFRDTVVRPEADPVDAIIFRRDGATLSGRLLAFLPASLSLQLAPHGAVDVAALRFHDIKSIHLIHPVELVVDESLVQLFRQTGGHAISPGERNFEVRFVDGESLRGQTKGFVKTRCGLFIYLTTAANQVVRIFVPDDAMRSYQVGKLLGQQLIDDALLEPSMVQQALAEQDRRKQVRLDAHFGDLHVATAALGNPQWLDRYSDDHSTFAPVRLGDILIEQGLVSREQMMTALGHMKGEPHSMLGQILVEMGFLSRSKLTQAVAKQLDIPTISLKDLHIDASTIRMVPKAYAFARHVLPIATTDRTLVVALENPLDVDRLDELSVGSGMRVVPVIANPEELSTRIAVEYSADHSLTVPASIEQEIETLQLQPEAATGADREFADKQVSESDTLLVRLVNKMIQDANKAGASDIHIEAYPEPQAVRVRFRVDGVLGTYMNLPSTLRAAIISRLKIMADMDISEHRKPQDGKIDFSRFAPLKLELRVASLPTANGLEDIVMRLLASSKPIALDDLGFGPDLTLALKKMMRRSYGLILVCGPTGSGKTTTLHSLLAEVNTAEKKIWTAEDPIEITHPGLRQIQMLPRAGLTFAVAMRAFLRADPDIIMVGEMRDSETAHMAIEASLTGHLVLSTLHTNSAPESVVRLLDLGLDPFSFSDALVGVLGQRLARRLCKHCKTPVSNASDDLAAMAHEYCLDTDLQADAVLADWQQRYRQPDGGAPLLYTAKGCDKCNHTGHKGRVGIYELMAATPALKKLVQGRAPVEQLFQCAAQEGMLTLRQYGLLKVLEGATDLVSVRSACV